ncbi:MAG: hypothetical protein KAH04_02510 [Psychrilyobacter sp.]|nr:hypothetical protein [Psychrilyobacter sp.]
MKKLFIFFILLISITSYSMDISVRSINDLPLKEVLIKVNNEIKISDNSGNATFDIPTNDNIINIILSKEGYKEEIVTIKNQKISSQMTFILKKIKRSKIIFDFPISDGVIEYREIGAQKYTKVPYFGKSKSIDFYFGNYDFLFSSKNTSDIKRNIFVNQTQKRYYIDSKIKENKFFILGNISKKQEINFYDKSIKKVTSPEDLKLTILKNGKIVKKIVLNDTFTPVILESGTFDFMVNGKFYDNTYFRGLLLNSSTNKNIVISLPSVATNIRGVIKNNNQFIGGVTLAFTDVNNKVYNTNSDFVGSFSIDLPPQKYKITIKKPGFTLNKKQDLIYDFSIAKNRYNLNLLATELPSSIDGIVYDNMKKPLPDALISLKSGDIVIKLKSNKFGEFSVPILPGMIFIKVEKDGYKSVGIVRKLERFSTLSGLNVTLSPYLANISGIISNDFFSLKKTPLKLRDTKGNVVANTLSNSIGYYEFSDIKTNENYFISVGVQSYKHYFSSHFYLDREDILNKNIILKNRKVRVYLEVVDYLGAPFKNKKISINKTIYSTDSNGFLLLELPEHTKTIIVRGVEYTFYKKIDLTSIYEDPYQLILKIK